MIKRKIYCFDAKTKLQIKRIKFWWFKLIFISRGNRPMPLTISYNIMRQTSLFSLKIIILCMHDIINQLRSWKCLFKIPKSYILKTVFRFEKMEKAFTETFQKRKFNFLPQIFGDFYTMLNKISNFWKLVFVKWTTLSNSTHTCYTDILVKLTTLT